MARAGRKRKDRLAPKRDARIEATPERVTQRMAIVGTLIVSRSTGSAPAWQSWDGTLLDALLCRRWLTEAQANAGNRFESLCKRYRAMLTVPKQIFEPSEGAALIDPDKEAERFHATRREYDDAIAAIGSMHHRRAVRDVLAGSVCDIETWQAFDARYNGSMARVREAFHNLATFYRY